MVLKWWWNSTDYSTQLLNYNYENHVAWQNINGTKAKHSFLTTNIYIYGQGQNEGRGKIRIMDLLGVWLKNGLSPAQLLNFCHASYKTF